ncbi:MAG TPA: SgcJ/EcaC family oxidoreductase [Candidatus Acidoferrales bacterium]|nr:SgcJ/EcaC family oxidoreductase [Candidatus Acidoferrales bacterium]
MKLQRSFASSIFVGVMMLAGCGGNQQPIAQTPPDTRAADETAIRQTDADWVKAAASKDAGQAASFYADDASLMAPGVPIATGREQIQKGWAGMIGMPGFSLTFAPTKVVVARSGDLAYEIGDYEMTMSDKRGKPQTTRAKYVVVWGKQADGKWKVLVDAPTTTQ